MARFGQMVKSARERKGISQGDLATAMGVSASVLSEMETGKRISAPDASWVRVISERVGINAVDLLISLGYLNESDFEDSRSKAVAILSPAIDSYNWSDDDLERIRNVIDSMGGMKQDAFGKGWEGT